MTPTEINRRVAEACGLPICTPNGPTEPESGPYFYDDGGDPIMLCRARPEEPPLPGDQYGAVFDPYHDNNDALWAAERFGLFSALAHGCNLSLAGNNTDWAVHRGDDDFVGVAVAPTPSAAICQAILALDAKAVK